MVVNVFLVFNRSCFGVVLMKFVFLVFKVNKYVFCCCVIKLMSIWLFWIFLGLFIVSCWVKIIFFKGLFFFKIVMVLLIVCSYLVMVIFFLLIFVFVIVGNFL